MSFLYALRLGRWGGLGFGALSFVITLAQAAGFYQIAGHTAAQRAAFGRSMMQLAGEFTVILPPPLRPDTVGGYVQWRAYAALSIVVAVWALASATGAARGDEERGLVEAVLATGVARADALLWRFLGFATYATVFAAASALAYAVAVGQGHDPLDLGALLGASLAIVAIALACYSLVLLVCQLAGARVATAAAGALLLALFLLNSLGRTLDSLKAWTWLSPFHYFDASNPLAPGGSLDVRATEILFAIAAVAGLGAAVAFAYRDVGSPLFRPPAIDRPSNRTANASPLWRAPVVRELYDRRAGLLVWAAGLVALGAVFVELTKQMVGPLLNLPGMQAYFNAIVRGDLYPSFLGYTWFGFAQLLVAGFAITQVARWSAEDVDGRLELMLANPISRTSVVMERATVLVVATFAIVVPAGFAVDLQAHHDAITLNAGRLVAATVLLVPFATFFAAVGSLLAAWVPRAALGVLAGIAFASYLLTQLGPLFSWPAWIENLSPFHLYGQPLTAGVDGTGLGILLGVSVVGFAASAFLLRRRDLGR
jgi:putative exporter of polyketide antibiotics